MAAPSPSNSETSKSEERISSLPGKGTETLLPPWLSRDWLWGLILVLAVILAYRRCGRPDIIWDDDLVCDGQSRHHRAARVEGNLDDERRRYLSADAHHILGGARVMGIGAAALSSRQCFDARSLCDFALAGLAEFANTGRVARRGACGRCIRCRWNRWRGSPR